MGRFLWNKNSINKAEEKAAIFGVNIILEPFYFPFLSFQFILILSHITIFTMISFYDNFVIFHFYFFFSTLLSLQYTNITRQRMNCFDWSRVDLVV